MKFNKLTTLCILVLLILSTTAKSQNTTSSKTNEQFTSEERPWLWWYWLGSAVDKDGLKWHLNQFKDLGYGGVSVAATYGVKGYESKDIPFMSSKWIDMINYTAAEAKKQNMGVDMSLTSAWPFGGPNVTKQMAAKYSTGGRVFSASQGEKVNRSLYTPSDIKQLAALSAYSDSGDYLDLTSAVDNKGVLHYVFPKGEWDVYALFSNNTNQMTKRSGIGGAGLVLDHFNKESVVKYLQRFDSLFINPIALRAAFNDSYEVYGADFTSTFLDEFQKRRGYDLRKQLNNLFGTSSNDAAKRVLCDYRETVGDLLLDNFVTVWTDWAHKHGIKTVEQAHGTPANWIDLYAAADIPQTESFGASPFKIKNVRIDPLFNEKVFGRPDKMLQKFASSAAHLTGKKYAASESATWLGNHFSVALSQVKPQIDELFISGINHIMLTCGAYSPKEIPFPGWHFYPAADFGHTTTFKKETAAFSLFVARSQKMLQNSNPDNEVLLYVPIHDFWTECQDEDGRSKLMMFTIHNGNNWFYKDDLGTVARELKRKGCDFDYISDRQLLLLKNNHQDIISSGGTHYKTIIVPNAKLIPLKTLAQLNELAASGVKVIFAYRMPHDVPGYYNLDERRTEFKNLIVQLKNNSSVYVGSDFIREAKNAGVHQEYFGDSNLEYVRKTNDRGTFYYIANQDNNFEEGWIQIGKPFKSACLYNPITGEKGLAKTNGDQIYLQLKPGESCILELYKDADENVFWNYFQPKMSMTLNENWFVSFKEGNPSLPQSFEMKNLHSWTTAPDTSSRYFSGIGVYEKTFDLETSMEHAKQYQIQLGNVREVADVWINDHYIGSTWSVPYNLYVKSDYLKNKGNKLRIEVRNLDANRMIWMDQHKIPWQTFFMVDVAYNDFNAANWNPMPSGLLGPVLLVSSNSDGSE